MDSIRSLKIPGNRMSKIQLAEKWWERGDFYHAGIALTDDLENRTAAFAAELLETLSFDLEDTHLRQEIVALLRATSRWDQAKPLFQDLRRRSHQAMPTPSQLLYEGALKLAHNLQTKDQASRFDGDQAARMVMLIGRLTHEDDSTSAIDAFEDLIRIRKRVLRVKLTV